MDYSKDSRIIFIPFFVLLIAPQREQFLFDSNLSGLVFDMVELEYIPGRNFKPSIRTPFGKIIHFNCPLKLLKNSISFSKTNILFKTKNVFYKNI